MTPTLLERQILRTRNGLAYLAGANRPKMGQTPRDLVWKRDKARLWRYRSGDRRLGPPILIVHSLVSKSYILDLLPGTSMIGYLIDEGFDVFLLDWVPPDPADAETRSRRTLTSTSLRRSARCSTRRARTRSR